MLDALIMKSVHLDGDALHRMCDLGESVEALNNDRPHLVNCERVDDVESNDNVVMDAFKHSVASVAGALLQEAAARNVVLSFEVFAMRQSKCVAKIIYKRQSQFQRTK